MENPQYVIQEEEKQNKAQDFNFLKSEAIKQIQKLTGAFWTDYNEHDPGVTILEQICYAMTDLAYRTDLDIQDHLLSENDEKTFYTPHEILSSNALTYKDYRKLFFDDIKELKNIWLFQTERQENSLLGLYKAFVDLDDDLTEERKKEIVSEIARIFAANRNLCEDIEEIVVLEPLYISIFADIEVDKMNDIEFVLADIYFNISEFFNPEVHFYSLTEMIAKGYDVNQIFEGPLLKHGFIRNSDLHHKLDKVVISEIIKIVMQVKGIASVKNLYLKANNEIIDNQLDVKKYQIPRIIFGSSKGKEDFTIHFYKGNISYQKIDTVIFKRKLNELESAQKRVYRPNDESLEIPEGRKINLQEYYSLQHQFPEVYGIGLAGIPNKPSEKRKAQAKQLKGFLLLYEQILANYLAQLAHVKYLFSSKSDIQQTYFHQTLDTIPQIEELLVNQPNQFVDDPFLGDYNIPLNYAEGLDKLMRLKDKFVDRRNRFLDFLLASNGDMYVEYSISQKNFYFNDEEYEKHQLKNKSRLLQYLPIINKNKSKGFDYFKDILGNANASGLEIKLSILLGLGFGLHSHENQSFKKEAIFEVFESRGLKIIKEDAESEHFKNWSQAANLKNANLTNQDIQSNFDLIDEVDFEDLAFDELEKKSLLSKTLPFRAKTITNDFLKNGLTLKNYSIGKINEDSTIFYLLFFDPEKENYLFIGENDTYEQALGMAKELTEFVRDLNIESEGLHLVEHILFRPNINDKKFGIYLLDEEGVNFLRTTQRYQFAERIQMIDHIKEHIFVYENYSVERRQDGDFEIHFQTSDKRISFVSTQVFSSVQEIHEKMDRLFNFLSDKDYIKPFEDKIAMFIQNSEQDRVIPEDFFSYKMSIVLPDWTARFSNSEFRTVVNEMIHENKPANVATEVLWLDVQDMKRFESLYYDWAKEKQKNGSGNKEKLDKTSNHFIEFLLQLYEKNR